MLSPQVTHVFSEGGKMSLARYTQQMPVVSSCQLAMLLDPDYALREFQRHQQEKEIERERETESKKQAEERTKEERKLKRMRPKRCYSAVPIKVEQSQEKEKEGEERRAPDTLMEEEIKDKEGDTDKGDVGLGGRVKRKCEEVGHLLHKTVRLAKRRKKTKSQPADNNSSNQCEGGNGGADGKGTKRKTDGGGGDNDKARIDTTQTRGKRFAGKIFLLLGRFMQKQADMRAFIEANGGEVASSLTRKVTHLLTAQGDDGTVTFKQARQRKLKIITEERLNDFLAQSKKKEQQLKEEAKPDPTTPRSTSAHRTVASPRIPLTPSSNTRKTQVLFEPSPSWKVVRYNTGQEEKELKNKMVRKAKRSRKQVEFKESVAENVAPNLSMQTGT